MTVEIIRLKDYDLLYTFITLFITKKSLEIFYKVLLICKTQKVLVLKVEFLFNYTCR